MPIMIKIKKETEKYPSDLFKNECIFMGAGEILSFEIKYLSLAKNSWNDDNA